MTQTVVLTTTLLYLILSFAPTSFAAPSITSAPNTISHGQTATIAGSGFGTKSPAAPFLWADFNSGINPVIRGVAGSWTSSEYVVRESNCGQDGSGCIRDDTVNRPSNVNWSWAAYIDTTGHFVLNEYSQKSYFYRKTRRNFSVTGKNWKVWRIWPSSIGTNPDLYIQQGNGSMGTEGCNSYCWMHTSVADITNWMQEEILLQSNSAANMSDAKLQYYIDSQLSGDCSAGSYYLQMKSDAESCSASIVTVFPVHGVMANESVVPADSHYWMDDVYMDNTWSRVMICAGSTWAARGHCEIQIPSAWSDTSVSVTVQQGTLTGSNYLYVVDSDNSANATGYPVIFNTSVTTPPAAPVGLTVQ